MIVHINFIIIIILSFLFSSREQSKKTKKQYLFLSNFLIGLTAAFRYTPYYADYLNYDAGMSLVRKISLEQIFANFSLGDGDAVFRKLLSVITQNNQIYFIVTALFLAISISIFIYRYSSDIYMSELAYVSLCFYSLSLNVVRQFIAISICILAYEYLLERKCIKYVCLILVAAFFHPSAIIMIPAYFLVNMKIYKNSIVEIMKIIFLSAMGYVFIRFGLNNEYMVYNESTGQSSMYGLESANILGIIMPITVIIAIFFARNNLFHENDSNKYLINLAYISLIFYIISVTGSLIIQRMALYFSIYTIISIPEISKVRVIKDGKTWIMIAMVLYYILWALFGKVNLITQFRF